MLGEHDSSIIDWESHVLKSPGTCSGATARALTLCMVQAVSDENLLSGWISFNCSKETSQCLRVQATLWYIDEERQKKRLLTYTSC